MNSNYTFRNGILQMDSSGIVPQTANGQYFRNTISQSTVILPTNIHINPKLCSSRSVYINKALYNNQIVEPENTAKKCERVHYNPKFFKAPTMPSAKEIAPLSTKKELKIHINPKFIKKEAHSKIIQPDSKKITNHSIELINSKNNTTDKLSTSSGIHVNPKFFNDLASDRISEALPPVSDSKPNSHSTINHSGDKFITKYKIVKKKNIPTDNNSLVLKKNYLKKSNPIILRKSRYKLVNGKYLIHANQKNMLANKSNKAISILCSSQNMKFVQNKLNRSKYNLSLINNKSILQQKIEARRRVKSSLNQTSPTSVPYRSKYKYIRSPANSQKANFSKNHSDNLNTKRNNVTTRGFFAHSEFHSISKTKLVRQSILQKKIELRRHTRKSSGNINMQKLSKYRLVRTDSNTPRKLSPGKTEIKSVRKKNSQLKFSSEKYRSEKIKKIALLTKRLRKNNEPCPFYSRYGRCKGKDRGTCLKLHDTKYITICKRFVKGECKDEKCTLSHEIRPEKMPTCHHYLAGLCKRTDCPFLHIKVNQKAPICRAFLQGFCADVFNCTKRHEYICPIFAEKGTCLRGKSCRLPHRTTTICSKLLEPDEFPLLNRKRVAKKNIKKLEVSKTNENIIFDSCEDKGELVSENKEDKPKEFKRYFLASLLAVSSDDSSDSSSE